jgi:hypothetical protein
MKKVKELVLNEETINNVSLIIIDYSYRNEKTIVNVEKNATAWLEYSIPNDVDFIRMRIYINNKLKITKIDYLLKGQSTVSNIKLSNDEILLLLNRVKNYTNLQLSNPSPNKYNMNNKEENEICLKVVKKVYSNFILSNYI